MGRVIKERSKYEDEMGRQCKGSGFKVAKQNQMVGVIGNVIYRLQMVMNTPTMMHAKGMDGVVDKRQEVSLMSLFKWIFHARIGI